MSSTALQIPPHKFSVFLVLFWVRFSANFGVPPWRTSPSDRLLGTYRSGVNTANYYASHPMAKYQRAANNTVNLLYRHENTMPRSI